MVSDVTDNIQTRTMDWRTTAIVSFASEVILDGEGKGIPILEIEDVSGRRVCYSYIMTGRVLDRAFPNTVDKAGLIPSLI